MSTTSFGSALHQTAATPQSPLGAIREVEDHSEAWIYIFNATGGDIPAGTTLISAQTASKARARVEAAAGAGALKSRVLGIAQHVIPQDHYGWIKRRGLATAESSGAVTANQAVLCDASGDVRSIASGSVTAADIAEVIGHVVVGNASATTCQVWLDL